MKFVNTFMCLILEKPFSPAGSSALLCDGVDYLKG
jgi:hypothetical protein